MQNQKTMSTFSIIQTALKKKFPSLNDKTSKVIAREAVLAPSTRMIQITPAQKLSKEDLSLVLAQEIDMHHVELNAMQAASIEHLNSGTDSTQEYFSWLEETTNILRHMTDGYVTYDDAIERQTFLKETDQREAELMVCLGLYESCKSSVAQEKVKFIRYKLQKLREMRTSIASLTSSDINVNTHESECDGARPYYAYFKALKNVPFGYEAPAAKKAELKLTHDLDEDLSPDFSYDVYLKNKMLDEMLLEDEKESLERLRFINEENSDNIKENTGR